MRFNSPHGRANERFLQFSGALFATLNKDIPNLDRMS
jgi:hypothetical protein